MDDFRRNGSEPAPPQVGGMARPTPRPTLGEAVLLMLIMLLVMGAGTLLIMIGRPAQEIDILMLGLVQVLAVMLVLVMGVRIAGAPAAVVFALRPVRPWMLAAGVPLAAAFALLMSAITAPVEAVFPMPEEYAVYLVKLLYPQDGADWIRVVLVASVVAPLGEEMLFRGLFLRAFLLRYGSLPALGLSALLFAVLHMNPWGLPEIFVAGWLLGWLVLRSGSLWPAILVHGLYNLTNVAMLASTLKGPPTRETVLRMSAGIWGSPTMVVAAGLVVVVLVLAFERCGARVAPWTSSS